MKTLSLFLIFPVYYNFLAKMPRDLIFNAFNFSDWGSCPFVRHMQGRRRTGAWQRHLPSAFLKGRQWWRRSLFITVSLVTSWFIKIDLKQIYCSYSRTQKIQKGFLYFLLFVKPAFLLNRNKHNWQRFFVFYKFPLPSTLLLQPFPSRCSGTAGHRSCEIAQLQLYTCKMPKCSSIIGIAHAV